MTYGQYIQLNSYTHKPYKCVHFLNLCPEKCKQQQQDSDDKMVGIFKLKFQQLRNTIHHLLLLRALSIINEKLRVHFPAGVLHSVSSEHSLPVRCDN